LSSLLHSSQIGKHPCGAVGFDRLESNRRKQAATMASAIMSGAG
jgi:hypothetical protein